MQIQPFKVERWLGEYENDVEFNLTSTSLVPFTLRELIEVTGADKEEVLAALLDKKLNYGDIEGNPVFRAGVAGFYQTLAPDEVIPTHGGIGAVDLAVRALIQPGDHVIAVLPAYQQIYSLPEALGARVDRVFLRREKNFELDTEELESMLTGRTRAICLVNPNNPTGQVMSDAVLRRLAALAERTGAYLICDESYRGLSHKDGFGLSAADIYENAVSLGSMSKAFAMAGLRLGWLASKNRKILHDAIIHRDYCTISCGGLDEYIGALAVSRKENVMRRNKEIIDGRLAVFRQWLANEPRVSCAAPKAGTVALAYLEEGRDSERFCAELIRSQSVLLTPGECFELKGCFRIGCGRETIPRLTEGLNRISSALGG